VFGFPETGADSPGSIMSAEGGATAHQTGYFDQQPYFSGSSSAASSPHAGVGLYHQQQMLQQQQVNTSAPSTPVACLGGSGSSSSNNGASSLSRSPGSTSIWGSLAQQGSHSSPPTPSVTSIAGRTTGMAANMAAPNMMPGADGGDFQRRLLEEQKMLHDAQQQEQHKLQLAQQWELEQMQRHQQEDQQTKARQQQQQHMQFQHSPPSVAPIHHDHNDPATWGGYNNVSATGAGGAGQFTGYLGGYGKGYTPAAIGGVAALAAVSAMAASRHTPTNGHRGDSGMEMDF
jgi:hypothetical protein